MYSAIEKKKKYIPSKQDVYKVIFAANPDTQDYLWAINDTMGRMGEINRMTWDDVDFENRCVMLWTRKKKDGHFTSREVLMTKKLYNVLLYRFKNRDKSKAWILNIIMRFI